MNCYAVMWLFLGRGGSLQPPPRPGSAMSSREDCRRRWTKPLCLAGYYVTGDVYYQGIEDLCGGSSSGSSVSCHARGLT